MVARRLNRYSLFAVVILGFVLLSLLWLGVARLDDYRRYHQELARTATAAVAIEIEHYVGERARLVGLFTEAQLPLIRQVLDGDRPAAAALTTEVTRYFPSHFTHTLTDQHGQNVFDDFEGLVGELCLVDIGAFIISGEHLPRVHPHSEGYHYDIMAPFSTGQQQGVFFVSFRADELAGTLRAAQAPGHQVMLVYADGRDLIEVTADGARNHWIREDYRLSEEESGRVLQRTPVSGTRWQVLDLHEPELFSSYRLHLLLQGGMLALLFILVVGVMLRYLRREEALRTAAERYKDEFFSNISHELRTPLTAIRGSLSLVLGGVSGELPAKGRELLEISLRNSERLGKLVDEILDLKKMESGNFEYVWQPLSLNTLVKQTVESLAAYGAQFGVKYVVEVPGETLQVRADAGRMEQVLANLLSNAAKYGPRDADVHVRLDRRGTMARISVIDQGEGIPPEFRNHLFQRFTRAEFSTGQRVGGAGLGLSITRQIVEDHAGSIDVERMAGVGNCFYVELPLLS